MRVCEEQADRENDARNRHGRGREKCQVSMSPHEATFCKMADHHYEHRACRCRGNTEDEGVPQREPRLAELKEHETPVVERKVRPVERSRPVLHKRGAQQHAVG